MKKKILILAAALMLIATAVSASSINGDYKGNPIVKVMSNGKLLESDEVPGMIYDGHTVVPISMLRQLGASVIWDQNTYSVDVKLPTSQPTQNADLSQVFKGFNETAKQYNASNVQLVFNNIGGYVSADLNLTGDNNLDTKNIMLTSSFVAKSPAIQIFVVLHQNNSSSGYYDIYRSDVESFINNELTTDAFIKTWKWNPNNVTTQPTTGTTIPNTTIPSPSPSSSPQQSSTPVDNSAAVCKNLIDDYNLKKVQNDQSLSPFDGYSSYAKDMFEREADKTFAQFGCTKP